jgi:hypothetical protein
LMSVIGPLIPPERGKVKDKKACFP